MKRVKFQTRLEPEYINNYKLVQAAFNRMGVTQVSDVVLGSSRLPLVLGFHIQRW